MCPKYSYECFKCESVYDEFQSITDPPLEICAKCGYKSLQRLITGTGSFILKGDGWAKDQYSSPKNKRKK